MPSFDQKFINSLLFFLEGNTKQVILPLRPLGFQGGSVVKHIPAKQETQEMHVPFLCLGNSSVEENGNSVQYSYLENPFDIGAWHATVHGDLVTKQQQQLRPLVM